MKIEISIGELVDKITILQIKEKRIQDESKLSNVTSELCFLLDSFDITTIPNELYTSLKDVNLKLWDIEDDIRIKEKNQEFDDEFIQLARSVYVVNDERANLKKEINIAMGSRFVEEKSYEEYQQ